MEEQPYKKPEISKTRKIFILAFMISFWVFFYWYHDSERTSKTSDQGIRSSKSLPEKTEEK
jgi:hypothetical protein